jgi:DNA-binding NtrC family response regulator
MTDVMHKILVVDDEAPLLVTLAANLELEGFEVMEAKCAEDALALIEQHTFDAVLSDIRMPGMSGVDLCRAIHRQQPELPVILMTAFTAEGVIRDAVNEGALMVIPKPFSIEHVVRLLFNVMDRPVVLVVDDAVEVAQTLVASLESVGLSARAVYDGAQAIEAFRAGDIGVCVIDMVLPGQSGADIIEQIHAIDRSVVVIAVSGFDVDDLFRRVAGHTDTILRKPFPPNELLQAIARARLQRGAAKPSH